MVDAQQSAKPPLHIRTSTLSPVPVSRSSDGFADHNGGPSVSETHEASPALHKRSTRRLDAELLGIPIDSLSRIPQRKSPTSIYSEESFEWTKGDYESRFLAGLTVAGLCLALLSTVYSLFYLDVFLQVYKLPLTTYAQGTLIFSLINTANDLGVAWLIDVMAIHSSRSDAIGLAGCLFALCFLTPFFRWKVDTTVEDRSHFWEGAHFVVTSSLYNTFYSFLVILLGSVVTDNHTMTDRERVRFMASGKLVNLVATFAVVRVGLEVFETEDISKFRVFVVIMSIVVGLLFILAQFMVIRPGLSFHWPSLGYRQKDSGGTEESRQKKQKNLQLRRVIKELWSLDNFRAWIGMEMLLECQSNFVQSFLKTFVDRLVFDAGVSRDTCDWILSLIGPLRQVASIICYIPIRRLGYRKVYHCHFVINSALSAGCLLFGSSSSTGMIIGFIVVHSVTTGAVLGAGFHLAMSDMVLEMKTKHALERRFDEPSLAGLFMGANALLCKPMDALLPIVASHFLEEDDLTAAEASDYTRRVLFYLLFVPSLVFSCFQMLSWSRYNLHPERTKKMRQDLTSLHSSYGVSDEETSLRLQ